MHGKGNLHQLGTISRFPSIITADPVNLGTRSDVAEFKLQLLASSDLVACLVNTITIESTKTLPPIVQKKELAVDILLKAATPSRRDTNPKIDRATARIIKVIAIA